MQPQSRRELEVGQQDNAAREVRKGVRMFDDLACSDSQDVIIRKKRAGERGITDRPTDFTWPEKLYSLSHVALPTPANDPLYGRGGPVSSPGIHLGDLDFRGERGVLQVPASSLMRLQWNPFYPYIEQRMLEFVHLNTPSD